MAQADGGPSEPPCQVGPGRVGLQRLSRDEYNRTVRDLFGVTTNPADVFPLDSLTDGFDNHATSLSVSPQLTELMLSAAETIAARALVNRRSEIVLCDPTLEPADACARRALAALALRVYRRPASAKELDDLMVLVAAARAANQTFEVQLRDALEAMLMAPQFLYRNVPSSGPADPSQALPLDDYALAARLSYFLWGSTPDDALLAAAAAGRLRDPATLRAEFDRLLADGKADALYQRFVRQWLQLGRLASASPDPSLFPFFDEPLRAELAEEPRLFFESLRSRDGSALELINGTGTFASPRTAALYGGASAGPGLTPFTTDGTRRAGVLTMPAVMAMTSSPRSPNIVRRGVWLAEAILCAAPPPPAAGVPAEPPLLPNETERERLARHRSDPSCASCHALIDPLGFGFEHYDALGRWRDQADGVAVDDEGRLPDGRVYRGIPQLVRLLEGGNAYSSCVTKRLMTYALGRSVGGAEQCVVQQLAARAVTPSSKLSDLLWAVVTSAPFQREQGAAP